MPDHPDNIADGRSGLWVRPEELQGNGISAWDARHGCWAQTWWDNHGSVFQPT